MANGEARKLPQKDIVSASLFSATIRVVNPNLGSWFMSKDSSKDIFMSCPHACRK
jgi:hypothetical protein